MGSACSSQKSIPNFNFDDPQLQEAIDEAKHGVTLTLRQADLLELAPHISHFSHLQQLYLRRCWLKGVDFAAVPRCFSALNKLINVELINMPIHNKLGSELFGPFLESLLIEHCHLSKLPPLVALRNLKVLDLSDNNLAQIPDDIGVLKSLEVLDLSSNFFLSYPDNLKKLSKLKALDLRNNQMSNIVESHLITFPQLTSLMLGDNRLTNFPDLSSSLNKLTKVDLSFNKISLIPDVFLDILNCNGLTSQEILSNMPKLTQESS
ncbi:hypothetical protein GEMRC1_011612 [Eukaryota sp. GEM-RC1]